jgi:hypothetical protein
MVVEVAVGVPGGQKRGGAEQLLPQRPHHRVVPHIVEQRGAQQPATTCVYGVGRGQAVISAAPFVATTILAAELQRVMNFALSEKEGCGVRG